MELSRRFVLFCSFDMNEQIFIEASAALSSYCLICVTCSSINTVIAIAGYMPQAKY